jgi:putative transposase
VKKYAWIKTHQNKFSITLMCELFDVSRAAYYGWLNRKPSARSKENALLSGEIKALFLEGRGTYGSRRIRTGLLKLGFQVSRRRVRRLMKLQGLVCKTKRKFKVTTDSKHEKSIAKNLLNRDFTASRPDEKYVGDITYIWTSEGWLYLAVVLDLFSRKIVGWALDKQMKALLVNDALIMALKTRRPPKGLLWHSDRGCQYASESHRAILKQHDIVQSMSRKGNCWDNSVAESFFHTLKIELTHQFKFHTREEAKQRIFEYIEVFYNRKRMHSANNYLSPDEYERQTA